MIGVVVIVYTITFYMPGSPAVTSQRAVELGLNKPFIYQLGDYIWKLVTRLDFGKSYLSNIPVIQELARRIPVTFMLGVMSILLMLAIGLPCGMVSALKQYSALDVGLTSLSLIVVTVPSYVLALLGAVFFGVKLRWLPVAGIATWKSWILPVASTALGGVATYLRMTRTVMLEVIRQDYIRSAKAKGLSEGDIVRKHAMINCMIPLATVIGLSIASIFSSTLIVEIIFSINGIGLYLMDGILQRDYLVVNGTVIAISLLVCIANLLVDIAYALIDPRIKAQFINPNTHAHPPSMTG